MAEIGTVTDLQEKTLLILDEVRSGNEATRAEIKRLRRLLKEGEKQESRLEGELVKLAQRATQEN